MFLLNDHGQLSTEKEDKSNMVFCMEMSNENAARNDFEIQKRTEEFEVESKACTFRRLVGV